MISWPTRCLAIAPWNWQRCRAKHESVFGKESVRDALINYPSSVTLVKVKAGCLIPSKFLDFTVLTLVLCWHWQDLNVESVQGFQIFLRGTNRRGLNTDALQISNFRFSRCNGWTKFMKEIIATVFAFVAIWALLFSLATIADGFLETSFCKKMRRSRSIPRDRLSCPYCERRLLEQNSHLSQERSFFDRTPFRYYRCFSCGWFGIRYSGFSPTLYQPSPPNKVRKK